MKSAKIVIKCEICGNSYFPEEAVEPEFYDGEDCPWCAWNRDVAAPIRARILELNYGKKREQRDDDGK
jgi:hypothetical protein